MEIIEYHKKYDEQIKNLLVELQEHLVEIDDWNTQVLYEQYKEESFKIDLRKVNEQEGKIYLAVENENIYGLIMGIVEIKDEIEETVKTDKEIFQDIIKAFRIDIHELISKFPKYNYTKSEFDRDYMQEADYEDEEWKQIGNLNYLISNYGRIKNKTTKKLKQLKFQSYGMQVLLWKNSKSYTITISRLVAEMFIRHIEGNERVFHKNNNIRDNYYKNLYIKSY